MGSRAQRRLKDSYPGEERELISALSSRLCTPTLELGVDELFTQLGAQTGPRYRLNVVFPPVACESDNKGVGGGGGFGGAPDASFSFGAADLGMNAPPSPLVVQDSIGPYDYAVLKADDKTAMLKWLNDNRYFIPAGTDSSVGPYIHPGAFFLALKLRAGKSSRDIQPVVVRYASDLPMIPIVLTSVGAQPDMGIQVWMAGSGRAIPRNYYHTVLNDAAIDWLSGAQNYNAVVIRATKEAEKRHTFITEYAGTSGVMKGVLDWDGRFGAAAEMEAIKDPVDYAIYLRGHGYAFNGPLIAILSKYIPIPQALAGLENNYYTSLEYYLGNYRQQHPDQFAGLDFTLDAKAATADIQARIVKPTLAAGKVFRDYPYLTRLYTTLSAEDMTADPVFSFNPNLPEVKNDHVGTLQMICSVSGDSQYDRVLTTEQGFSYFIPGSFGSATLPAMPASLRIERLREAGSPEVVTDNTGSIHSTIGDNKKLGACNVEPGRGGSGPVAAFSLLVAAAIIGANRKRRR
mgnify:CR=1 FL=1